mgnify:CR=1 FL=1
MSTTAIALIGLVVWTVVLAFIMIGKRLSSVMSGEKDIHSFQPDGKDVGDFGLRATRAHLNSLEVLPLAATIMLLAIATGNTAVTDGLAMAFLYCRVIQSVIHLISVSKMMVLLRATFFTVQFVFLIIWAYSLCCVTS